MKIQKNVFHFFLLISAKATSHVHASVRLASTTSDITGSALDETNVTFQKRHLQQTNLPSTTPSTTPSAAPSLDTAAGGRSSNPTSASSEIPSTSPTVSSSPSTDDPCDTYECANGGTCELDGNNMPMCNCLPGYQGAQCDTVDPICSNFRCSNGGICQVTPSFNPFCECANGYVGVNCDTKCDLDCQNGGACELNAMDQPYCACTENFVGETCEQSRVQCGALSYCYNGGKCVLDGGNRVCDCSDANTGSIQWEGSECLDEPEEESSGVSISVGRLSSGIVASSVIVAFAAFGF